jgi:hypothetical protein
MDLASGLTAEELYKMSWEDHVKEVVLELEELLPLTACQLKGL